MVSKWLVLCSALGFNLFVGPLIENFCVKSSCEGMCYVYKSNSKLWDYAKI